MGNLTQTTDRNGRKVAYNYDTLNRQTSERWLDSNSATIKTFSAGYDAVGHLITSTNPDAAYTYTYDAVDRVSSIDNTGTVGVPAVKFNYGYDAVGNLLSVNDSINGTNAGITGYTYDLLNRVTKLTQGGTGVQTKRVDMAYNAVNQLTSLSRFSGVNGVVDTSYTYDLNQRLIQLSHKKGASTIASYDYSYDNADKLAETVSSVDGTSSYSYDSTNQLTGTDHSSQTDEAYSYDANGNRTYGGYVTGVNNQLLSDGIYDYTYDDEGNRTKRVEIATGYVTEYVWDYRNRLTGVLFKDAGGSVTKTIDYIYDGNNQRIGKRIDGAVVERYVIDRNQIALVFDGAGNQTHRYLYGTAVDQVLADETATSMVWALADNQGTVKDLVDNSGVVVNHITYDSFGKVVAQSNAGVEFRYGYTGREQDGETGLDYYRARYYDASNGRFISEDPIGFAAGDGNLTRYVFNSPVNYNDPSGKLSAELIALKALSHPGPNNGSKPSSIWFYNIISPDYPQALAKATYWFYVITERNDRKKKEDDIPSGIDWLITGFKLKNNPGKVVLRPWGTSKKSQKKLEPKLDFQQDENGQYAWPKGTKISEIIFQRLDDKEPKDTKCPDPQPQIEPLDIFNPPQPRLPPRSQPNNTPSPSPWPELPNVWPVIRFIFGGERA